MLTSKQINLINERVKDLSDKAGCMTPHVTFTVTGKVAGLAKGLLNEVSFNPVLAAENFDHYLKQTVGHEVAHIVVYQRFGVLRDKAGRRISHGKEWRKIMAFFDLNAERCHDYNTTNVAKKIYKTTACSCSCQEWNFTAIRINRMAKGTKYFCPKCKGEIVKNAV